MARNIEIKARLETPAQTRKWVEELADGPPATLMQEDTFFNVPEGRFKLRLVGSGQGQLIFYRRRDQAGPKLSEYEIVPVADAARLGKVLGRALGVRGVVRKRRAVYMAGRTRIHLDEVEGLGSFIELEVVLREGEDAESGRREAEELMERLGIGPTGLMETAYVDLLE